MLPVHYSRLFQLLDRDGVPTQTLKSSLQIACPWSHEINAGVLSGTGRTPVYQQGAGTRQYLISSNVSETKHIYTLDKL